MIRQMLGILLLTFVTINIYAADTTITAKINNTRFFATKLPAPRVSLHDDAPQTAATLLARYTPTTNAWYANNCNNKQFNELIDSCIAYLKTCTFKKNARPLAVFDVDETAVSAYYAYYDLLKNDMHKKVHTLIGTEFEVNHIIPIQPISRLYNYFISAGIDIAFVTGRSDTAKKRKYSTQMLTTYGYTNYKYLFMQPQIKTQPLHKWKESVRSQLAKTHQIVATIDDDWRNLQGKNIGQMALLVPCYLLDKKPGEDAFYERLLQKQQNMSQVAQLMPEAHTEPKTAS